MFKLMLFLLGCWIVWKLTRRGGRQPSAGHVEAGDMVRCAVCGVHVPKTEAIRHGEASYCCEAHFLERSR